MKVFRFMSKEEFEKYKNGDKLKNKTIHKGNTNSIGFCFLNEDEYVPETASHFLSGIVDFDVCAVFETNKKLNKTYGVYAKPINRTGNTSKDLMKLFTEFREGFTADEYCTTEYSNKDFKLLKYSENLWRYWKPEIEKTKFNWSDDKCLN